MAELVFAFFIWVSAFVNPGYLTDEHRDTLNDDLGCELYEDGSGTCHGMTFPGYDTFNN